METENLRLVVDTPEFLRAILEGPDAFQEAFGIRLVEGVADFLQWMSPEELARLHAPAPATSGAPGFWLVHKADNASIGACGCKGPPDRGGVVAVVG